MTTPLPDAITVEELRALPDGDFLALFPAGLAVMAAIAALEPIADEDMAS